MERNRKTTIIIIITLLISIIGLGIAFAAFSTTLTINGSASVEASSWNVVFEGITNPNVIDDPVLVGTATEVTHPTIKNNSTEISNYEVTLKSPGDSVTYNFKIHNKGDYAANVSSVTVAGVTNPTGDVNWKNLVTDSTIANQSYSTLIRVLYKLYYTDSNILVGTDAAKDCLEPGESVNVTLKIIFSSSSETNTGVLPNTNLVLDNLGVSILYNQYANGRCFYDGGERETVTNVPFDNFDGAYYKYENKSFIGTGVNNVIITENITSKAKYSTSPGTSNGDGTYSFSNRPAATASSNYCTGCRLMTYAEALSWTNCDNSQVETYKCIKAKTIAKYNGTETAWWLDDNYRQEGAYGVSTVGALTFGDNPFIIWYYSKSQGVRPAASIPSTATMTGAGTKTSPYVITLAQ